jgi:hypothetical protein
MYNYFSTVRSTIIALRGKRNTNGRTWLLILAFPYPCDRSLVPDFYLRLGVF